MSRGVKSGDAAKGASVLEPLDVGKRFSELAGSWKKETRLSSSMTDRILHAAYQQIIGLGRAALPLILEELARQPDYWFWALFAIAGENPVTADEQGDLDKMTAAWLNWGQQRGVWEGPKNGA